jgi:hypothetical protein
MGMLSYTGLTQGGFMGLFSDLDDLVVTKPLPDDRNECRRHLLHMADAAPKLLALLKQATPAADEGCEDCAHGVQACHCWAKEARDLIEELDDKKNGHSRGAVVDEVSAFGSFRASVDKP